MFIPTTVPFLVKFENVVPKQLTHVATRIKEPKSEKWIFVDPVAGPREREAARTAKEILTWSLD